MRIPNGTGQGAVSAASGTSEASPSRSASVSVSAPNSTSVVTTISSSSSRTTDIGVGIGVASEKPVRDSSWLELEVCRDFQRLVCPRSAEECRFAHPESGVVKDGKVTCCYDFLKVSSGSSFAGWIEVWLASSSLWLIRVIIDVTISLAPIPACDFCLFSLFHRIAVGGNGASISIPLVTSSKGWSQLENSLALWCPACM